MFLLGAEVPEPSFFKSRPSPRKRGPERMGRALSIVRMISQSQWVTDASSPSSSSSSSLFFPTPPPFLFPPRLALSKGQGNETPPPICPSRFSFCSVRGHRWPRYVGEPQSTLNPEIEMVMEPAG